MSVSVHELPDCGLAHAAQPGKVRVQRQLRLPPEAGLHAKRGQTIRPVFRDSGK